MVARIAGGAVAGGLLSLAPLIVVNALSLTSNTVDPSSTALAGALALALGIILGGLAAGVIGGRRGGAIAGAIAGTFFAACLIGLMYELRAQGNLPNLVALHPVRTVCALVFIGALVAGVAIGAAALTGRRPASAPGMTPRSPEPRGNPTLGVSQPRAGSRELTPARRMDQGWPPDPRRTPPGSGPRPPRSQPARRPMATQRDAQGRWPDAPDRW